MSPIPRVTPSLVVLGITFALSCCIVHAPPPTLPNDREDNRNSGSDKDGNEQYRSSFQAHINKLTFFSVSNLRNKIYFCL